MQLSATLLAILAVLALTEAAPAPSPARAPEPVVDRLSIVASNRARFSAAAATAASYASVASGASAASLSAASAANRASVARARSVIVASNRARLSAHAATATPSGFATLPASMRPTTTTSPAATVTAPPSTTSPWVLKGPATTNTSYSAFVYQIQFCAAFDSLPNVEPGYCEWVSERYGLTKIGTRTVVWPTASAA
ncbi:hypothetical protein JCM10449v2_007632 [Rhodotorula kratochvilovae]